MAAVNMQMMSTNMPLDFLPMNPHSRSASVSSRSSPSSRPDSAHGGVPRLGIPPSAEDLYHASYNLGLHHHNSMSNENGRHSSHSSGYSLLSGGVLPSGQSPPNHNVSNPSLIGHRRPSHLRARAAASPYPRDNDSVHSSSSETEDMAMFLGNSSADYHNMFGAGQHIPQNHETMHAAGAFGRMSLGQDNQLEKLAANVRAATTTSASDRAKQIFVQAW
jgi:regulatory factor X